MRHGRWFCESSVYMDTYLYSSISLKSIRERRRTIGSGLHWYIENIVRLQQHTYYTLSVSYIISQYIGI